MEGHIEIIYIQYFIPASMRYDAVNNLPYIA